MLEFTKPIPVHTPLGDGYAIYVTNTGMLENDEWTVALDSDGQVRHFLSKDVKVQRNAAYGIAQKGEPMTLNREQFDSNLRTGWYIPSKPAYTFRDIFSGMTKADNL